MAAVIVDEQRAYIQIEHLRGKTGREIDKNLQEACGTYAVSFKTVYRWISRFKTGILKHFRRATYRTNSKLY